MVQVALSLVFLAQTLLGPALCCCSLPRISFFSGQSAKAEEKQVPSCCQHAKASPGSTSKKSSQRQCPCKEHQPKKLDWTVAAPSNAEAIRHEIHQAVNLQANSAANDLTVTVVPRPFLVLHFLAAKDLLRAHHLLRC